MKQFFKYLSCCFFKAQDSDNVNASVPDHIREICTCPIKQTIMYRPVIAADGFTYEEKAITEWRKTYRDTYGDQLLPISPMTGLALEHERLVPNQAVKALIKERSELTALSKAEEKEDEADALERYEAQIRHMQTELSQNPVPRRFLPAIQAITDPLRKRQFLAILQQRNNCHRFINVFEYCDDRDFENLFKAIDLVTLQKLADCINDVANLFCKLYELDYDKQIKEKAECNFTFCNPTINHKYHLFLTNFIQLHPRLVVCFLEDKVNVKERLDRLNLLDISFGPLKNIQSIEAEGIIEFIKKSHITVRLVNELKAHNVFQVELSQFLSEKEKNIFLLKKLARYPSYLRKILIKNQNRFCSLLEHIAFDELILLDELRLKSICEHWTFVRKCINSGGVSWDDLMSLAQEDLITFLEKNSNVDGCCSIDYTEIRPTFDKFTLKKKRLPSDNPQQLINLSDPLLEKTARDIYIHTKYITITQDGFSWLLFGIGTFSLGAGIFQYSGNSNFLKPLHPYDWISLLAFSFLLITVSLLWNKSENNTFNCVKKYIAGVAFTFATCSGVVLLLRYNTIGFSLLVSSSILSIIGKLALCSMTRKNVNESDQPLLSQNTLYQIKSNAYNAPNTYDPLEEKGAVPQELPSLNPLQSRQ